MKRILMLAALMLTLAATVHAQSVVRPAFSLSRLNIGAGANYGWYDAADASSQILPFRHEWQVGLFGAYSLLAPPGNSKGTTVSLVGASLYGIDNKMFHSYVGVRLGLYDGSRQ